MTSYLVTGANGQLGRCFHALRGQFPKIQLHFASREEVDITQPQTLEKHVVKKAFNGIINCAAYTEVDQAEKELDEAYAINEKGVKQLVAFCEKHRLKLIHFSTDYVFDGKATVPYQETDTINPISVYGQSKARGEKIVLEAQIPAVVLRISWLFSPFGKNFVKTIAALAQTKKKIEVVADQFGCPTSGLSLARMVLEQLENPFFWKHNCYHFANQGSTTWFQWAQEIIRFKGLQTTVVPITTQDYPTPAQRPKNSILSTQKIENTLPLSIPSWQTALRECLEYHHG